MLLSVSGFSCPLLRVVDAAFYITVFAAICVSWDVLNADVTSEDDDVGSDSPCASSKKPVDPGHMPNGSCEETSSGLGLSSDSDDPEEEEASLGRIAKARTIGRGRQRASAAAVRFFIDRASKEKGGGPQDDNSDLDCSEIDLEHEDGEDGSESDDNVRVRNPRGKKVIRDDDEQDDQEATTGGVGESKTYDLKNVLAMRLQNGIVVYLVSWEGFPLATATWERSEADGGTLPATWIEQQGPSWNIKRKFIQPWKLNDRCIAELLSGAEDSKVEEVCDDEEAASSDLAKKAPQSTGVDKTKEGASKSVKRGSRAIGGRSASFTRNSEQKTVDVKREKGGVNRQRVSHRVALLHSVIQWWSAVKRSCRGADIGVGVLWAQRHPVSPPPPPRLPVSPSPPQWVSREGSVNTNTADSGVLSTESCSENLFNQKVKKARLCIAPQEMARRGCFPWIRCCGHKSSSQVVRGKGRRSD
jgi:hypothetical protein